MSYRNYWLTSSQLGLDGNLAEEWKNFISEINLNGVRLSSSKDHLTWIWDTSSREVKNQLAYEAIVHS